jgi:hypothetical protein
VTCRGLSAPDVMIEGRMRRTTHPPSGRGARTTTVLAAGILTALTLTGCGGEDEALAGRQAEVAQRGAEVMPFDLEATTHRFEPTETGLVQTVTADDPRDREQIALIREHLEEEAGRFAQGDFGDPATIHGHDMPGLAELRDGAANIDIQFETRDDGARLIYATDDPDLIEALHRWGEAQVSDHGEHAEHAEHGN